MRIKPPERVKEIELISRRSFLCAECRKPIRARVRHVLIVRWRNALRTIGGQRRIDARGLKTVVITREEADTFIVRIEVREPDGRVSPWQLRSAPRAFHLHRKGCAAKYLRNR